ncbi:MAG: hypothetical protein KC420_14595 [Myxococcales bacterium]|nr:hypothetical protein [Myxococcales bacterium]MCB9570172.1 hypothetical protein [Myxococcales bacterium]MCB9705813.1 hypothetical protein [Myxococcales bacterium]
MASFTAVSKRKRARRHKNAGQDRKKKLGRRSTLSAAELFEKCGEPGQPAPSASAK